MKIEPKDIQVGDRITVRGTVRQVGKQPGGVDIAFDGGSGLRRLSADEIARSAEITRPPRPLAVGDLVSACGSGRYRIDAIYPDGFVRASPEKVRVPCIYCFPVADLTRIEETTENKERVK